MSRCCCETWESEMLDAKWQGQFRETETICLLSFVGEPRLGALNCVPEDIPVEKLVAELSLRVVSPAKFHELRQLLVAGM
jgi:hypothetical protein